MFVVQYSDIWNNQNSCSLFLWRAIIETYAVYWLKFLFDLHNVLVLTSSELSVDVCKILPELPVTYMMNLNILIL